MGKGAHDRRLTAVAGAAGRSPPTGLDRRTSMYYSAGWQLLQEDIDNHTNR